MEEEELRYTLPHDVFHYEPRYFAGLTVTDMFIAAMPAMVVLSVLHSIFAAVMVAVLSLALLKRFDGLGRRSIVAYVFSAGMERRRQRQFVMPQVLPGEGGTVTVMTWDGQELYRLEDVHDSGTSNV